MSAEIFSNLVHWICEKHQGQVHAHLDFKELTSCNNRGIFAKNAISKGETLIVLPESVALSGKSLPRSYQKNVASNYIRCVASYLKARVGDNQEHYKCYLDSLPQTYDSLLNWSDEQVSNLLAGTALGQLVQADRSDNLTEKRYRESARCYLEHLCLVSDGSCNSSSKIIPPEEELNQFREACMCVSSRGFHLLDDASHVASISSTTYGGPFLLPLVDLLNHCPIRKCTTLQRHGGSFSMVAERDILAGEEILHSYGDSLTAAQLLQTFGFVPYTTVQRALIAPNMATDNDDLTAITPAILSKSDVVSAFQSVISSSFPEQVRRLMVNSNIDGESWNFDAEASTSRDLAFLPEELVIDRLHPLTNELITLCVMLLLPNETYNEFMEEEEEGQMMSLVDRSILDDYFLGKLVCETIVSAVSNKLETYSPITIPSSLSVKKEGSDQELLQELLSLDDEFSTRAKCGLTIRMEEKSCLCALRKEVMSIALSLDVPQMQEPARKRKQHDID